LRGCTVAVDDAERVHYSAASFQPNPRFADECGTPSIAIGSIPDCESQAQWGCGTAQTLGELEVTTLATFPFGISDQLNAIAKECRLPRTLALLGYVSSFWLSSSGFLRDISMKEI
jgi:hypothetical protein